MFILLKTLQKSGGFFIRDAINPEIFLSQPLQ